MRMQHVAQVRALGMVGVVAGLAVSLAMVTGCAAGPRQHGAAASAGVAKTSPSIASPASSSQQTLDTPASAEAIRILRDTLARCDALDSYEILFHRRERCGLIASLSEWEDLKVYYRKQPHSIRMTWLDPNSEYRECLYVDGANDGNMAILPRKGLFGLPAAPLSVPPQMAVTMGKSLRPITDFGLATLIRRVLERLDEAREAGGAVVTDQGLARLDKTGADARHLVVRYPRGFGRSAKQDIYIDPQTGYPVGSYQWLPNGDLLAAYVYGKPTVIVPSDEAFSLSAPGKSLAGGK